MNNILDMKHYENDRFYDSEFKFDGEIFVQIPNVSGYLISNYGRVMSVTGGFNRGNHFVSQSNRIMRDAKQKNGYRTVSLRVPTGKRTFYIHRLVAKAFTNPKKHLREVDHINDDKRDNRIENLEWVSSKENKRRAIESGQFDRKGEKHHMVKFSKDEVLDILDKYHNEGMTAKQIQGIYGGKYMTIYAICKAQTWKWLSKEFLESNKKLIN